MFDREDGASVPSMDEISGYIHNSLWEDFFLYMKQEYQPKISFEFSRCSWETGWNVKFKKGGRALCTVYPRENYFAVMIVIGKKEKEEFERELSSFCDEIQQIYQTTKEGNGQKWLMMELEDYDRKYDDVKKILSIKAS